MARAKKKTAETEGPVEPTIEGYVPRLQEIYKSAVAPELQKRFKYKSTMQVPRLVKVTLNVGLGEATQNPKLLDAAAEEIARMTFAMADGIALQKLLDPESVPDDMYPTMLATFFAGVRAAVEGPQGRVHSSSS